MEAPASSAYSLYSCGQKELEEQKDPNYQIIPDLLKKMVKQEKDLARPYELPLTFASSSANPSEFWEEFGFVMQAAKFN